MFRYKQSNILQSILALNDRYATERQGTMSIGIDSYASNSTANTANAFNRYNKPSASKEENAQVIRDRINELLEKMENGDIEPSYQIGGRSFTEREWDKMLSEFDAAEDTLKKLVEEERERLLKADEIKRIQQKENVDKEEATKQKETAEQKETADRQKVSRESIELLTADSVSCTYMENDNEVTYVTSFGPDGIKCKKLGYIGEEGWLWEISYSNTSQYSTVMNFLEKFPAGANLVFASQKNFWEDFLKGKTDQEEYLRNYK